MEIPPVSTNGAMMAMVRQMETNTALQTMVLKQMAESQQAMAEILHAIGVGQQVDLSA